MKNRIRTWIFVGSMLLAILAGLEQLKGNWAVWVLAVLGLIVGVLNISKLEVGGFLISAIALRLSAGAINVIPEIGGLITNILANVVIFTSASLLVIAVKEIFIGKDLKDYRIWVLLAGILLAVLAAAGLLGAEIGWPTWVLAAIGVIVGILDILRKGVDKIEAGRFVISAIALQLSATAIDHIPFIGDFLSAFFTNIVVLISAALLVISFVATFRALDELN
jgi:hypothetical protein